MLRKPLTAIADDTEDAPWMVMGTPQFHAAARLYDSLIAELRARGSSLFVASMLPIKWRAPGLPQDEQLSPDLLIARVPNHPRGSYRLAQEGIPPALVLEIVSPVSVERDLEIKPERYEAMGVEEYAIFAPPPVDRRPLIEPALQGHRRDRLSGHFLPWQPDEQGRLWSEVLELWLVGRGEDLRLQRADGSWVLTIEEESEARRREATARRELELENARLRAELEQRRLT